MMDDAELLRSYAENKSEAAFAEFVGRRIGFVYATARRQVMGMIGDAQIAEEITQTVFRLAAQKASALAAHPCLAGWLYTATSNVAFRQRRDALRRRKRDEEAIFMSELQRTNERANASAGGVIAGNETENAAESAAMRETLDDALGALREGERQAVLLRFFEGHGFAEIGAKLEMSEEAARKRVARAVEKMRGTFAKRGVTSSAAALGTLMTAEAAHMVPAGLAASVSASAMATASVGLATVTATTAAGAGAFLTFMSSVKITTAAIVALLIAAGGIYYGVQSDRSSLNALTQAQQENKSLASQLRALKKQNAAATAAPAPVAKHDPLAAGRALMAAHPELKKKQAALQRAYGMAKFLRLSHEMNLSPEQNARLAEIAERMPSFPVMLHLPGYGAVELVEYIDSKNGREKRAGELRNLLGDEGYKRWLDLSARTAAGMEFSRDLNKALCLTDEPLTSRQAWALDEIAYDLKQNHADIVDPEVRWSVLVERAKPILSSNQTRALVAAGDRVVWYSELAKWNSEYRKATKATTQTK